LSPEEHLRETESPSGDTSSEEDDVQLHRARKRLRTDLDSDENEQGGEMEESLDKRTPSGSSDVPIPKLNERRCSKRKTMQLLCQTLSLCQNTTELM